MTARFRQVRERIAMWLAPRLPKLLARSGTIIESLEYKAEQNDDAQRAELAKRLEIIGELEEAAALADGAPWQAAGKGHSHAGQQLIKAGEALRNIPLKETIYGMAELEIALEDRGWKRLIAQSQYEFSRFGIQSIILICRLYRIKNSLARRGVDVSAFYVFGRGLEITSPDEAANETLSDFFDDPRNASQFSHTGLVKREQATWTDGNLFWAFFADPADGRLISRGIDAIEVSDIITDPNDADTPWFYRRDWTELQFDPATGRRMPKQRSEWYFALGYEDMAGFPVNQRMIEGQPVALDSQGQPIPVLHHMDGGLPGWRFGCPRMYPAIDWLRAYRHVLEDLCTLWRALSRFAWNVETKGGAPAIAVFKQTLATTLANDLSQIETNPPPVTGSAFISSPSNKIAPMKTGGATMNPDSARPVLHMICAAFGLPETFFGNLDTGNLATATSLDRPTELMFAGRQEVWREILQRVGQYVLTRSLKAPKGKLREAVAKRRGIEVTEVEPDMVLFEAARKEGTRLRLVPQSSAADPKVSSEAGRAKPKPEKITIDVKFPDILEGDILNKVTAIVDAMTLKGGEVTGIDEKTGIGLLLSELGVEDVQAVLDAMYPEKTYEQDRTIEPEPPTKITSTVTDTTAGTGQDTVPVAAAPPPPAAEPATESVSRDPVIIDKAVKALIAAAARNLREVRRSA